MRDLLADLLPWLACFYALDGLGELRRGHWLLADAGLGRFRWLGPGHGLRLVGLWPAEEVVAAFDMPVLLAEEGILLLDPSRRADLVLVEPALVELVGWEGLAPEVEGKKVLSGGRLLARAPHPALARAVAAALARGAAAPASGRIEAAGGAPDLAAERAEVVAARHRQRHWRFGLRVTALTLCFLLFGVGSWVAWGPDRAGLMAGRLLAQLGLLLVVEAVLAVGFLRAAGQPWGRALAAAGGLLAWPVSALHPLAHLSRGLWAGREALALAAALLPSEGFLELASREAGRVAEGRRRASGPLGAALARRERTLDASARAAGLDPAALRRSPRQVAGEAAWCPTCRSTFLAGPARCSDCGVLLVGFGNGAGQGASAR